MEASTGLSGAGGPWEHTAPEAAGKSATAYSVAHDVGVLEPPDDFQGTFAVDTDADEGAIGIYDGPMASILFRWTWTSLS